MLRFRPIAPKPAAGGSGSDGSSMDNKNAFFAKGRTKRKYVRVRKNNSSSSSNGSGYKRERKIGEEEKKEGSLELEKRAVTLQLLPEKSERNESPESGSWGNIDDEGNGDPPELPMWLNKFGDNKGATVTVTVSTDEKDHTAAVESWVTVESVTDSCMSVGELGSTDEERMRNLEEDTCPGFVSDGFDRVTWVNRAFKRMVVRKEQNDRQSAENKWTVEDLHGGSTLKLPSVWAVDYRKNKNLSGDLDYQRSKS
ncbi:hypothetical protein CMV_007476 [Castanea mollissima]|uniref:DUF7950 domain-containing protein n=1 Tax=Castanea mollissima TaxID=60419 RepID=A0A8J4RJR3_9ROSI|nr:hypothetical protein CMV_007476 [Castanea mollissima]